MPTRGFQIAAPLVAAFVAAALITAGLAGQWRLGTSGPEVVILGSGGGLSVLVRSGESRLLIASGSDIDDFDRAYGSVLRPTISRLDILVVAGTGPDLAVPERLVSRGVGRAVLGMRPIGSGQATGLLADANVEIVRSPRSVHLHDGVTVALEPYPDPTAPDAWSVTITRDDARLLIVPTLDGSPTLGTRQALSALVVTGGADVSTLSDISAGGVIVRGKTALPLLRVTDELAGGTSATRVWPVHDSEALSIRFRDGHLEIDNANARQLKAPTSETT